MTLSHKKLCQQNNVVCIILADNFFFDAYFSSIKQSVFNFFFTGQINDKYRITSLCIPSEKLLNVVVGSLNLSLAMRQIYISL